MPDQANNRFFLQVELLSDTTFGRGTGTTGVVDVEIEHDDLGLPCLGAKALHGLLRDSWLTLSPAFPELWPAARGVFGLEGSLNGDAMLRLDDAFVEPSVLPWIQAACGRREHPIHPIEILAATTDIRRQTAEDRRTGAPEETTLRSMRVALRGLRLQAPARWLCEPGDAHRRCLALSCLGLRHGGMARSRGRGHLKVTLDGDLDRTRKLARGEEEKG